MLIDSLRRRFSVREFQNRPIPDQVLDDMLDAGRLSPSGGNAQSWVFGVITDRTMIGQIADAAYGQTWIAGAPLLVVLCTIIETPYQAGVHEARFPEYYDATVSMDDGLRAALHLEEHQTKIAGTHMAMVALENGVGSTWVSLFDVKRVARLLELPEGCLPSEILAFGYPGQQRKPTPKKDLREVVFFDTFGKQDEDPS